MHIKIVLKQQKTHVMLAKQELVKLRSTYVKHFYQRQCQRAADGRLASALSPGFDPHSLNPATCNQRDESHGDQPCSWGTGRRETQPQR